MVEYMPSVTASRVLRKIFWPYREDVTGCHRKSHNEELDLYKFKSRNMWSVCHVAHAESMANAYKVLVGKHHGKRPLCRLTRRLEDKY